MDTTVNKFKSIALTSILLLSMLIIFAAPVKAGTLEWTAEGIPVDTPSRVINSALGAAASDFAVSTDGKTIYLVTGSTTLLKSIDGGSTWTSITLTGLPVANFVAVAPDNANIVAYVSNAAAKVLLSTTGGMTAASFSDLTPNAVETGIAGGTFTDIDITPALSGVRRIAVSGETSGGAAQIASLSLDGVTGWVDLTGEAGGSTDWDSSVLGTTNTTRVMALKFSPSFPTDRMLMAISSDSTTGKVFMNVASFATTDWNSAGSFEEYTGANAAHGLITTDSTPPLTVNSARIAPDPNYDGADPGLRVVFVSVDTGAVASSGIWRMEDANSVKLSPNQRFYSVAFNGETLAGGLQNSNAVYYSNAPLAGEPEMVATTSRQRPSGGPGANSLTGTMVAWAGTDLVATTNGNEAAFSRSGDGGVSFNDVSLINTTIPNIADIAVLPEGKWYMVTNDGADVSLWRKTDATWERLQSFISPAAIAHSIRIAPDNLDVVFIVNNGTSFLYVSDDSGEKDWITRNAADNITDLAVESASVVYSLSGGDVRKSSDGGFNWDDSVAIGGSVEGGNIRSLGEDKLIVGASNGLVAYSTDGGASWDRTTIIPGFSTATAPDAQNIVATCVDLTENDFIYAAVDDHDPAGGTGAEAAANVAVIYRWKVGQSSLTPWDKLTLVGNTTTTEFSGISLLDGVLYAVSYDPGADAIVGNADDGVSRLWRSLNPTAARTSVSFGSVAAPAGVQFDVPRGLASAPEVNVGRMSNLQVSAGNRVWAISNQAGDAVYSFTDTLASPENIPKLDFPADNATVGMNPVSGFSLTEHLTWERPSEATDYQVQVAFDEEFTELVINTSFGLVNGMAGFDPAATPVSFTIGAGLLNPDDSYFWRVRATEPLPSAWSETRNFNTASLLPPPPSPTPPSKDVTLSVPFNGATGVVIQPAFAWQAVPGATLYEIIVATDPGFTKKVFSDNAVKTNGFVAPGTLEYNTVYYWEVRANVTGSPGNWSTGIFTTTAPPTPAVTQLPQAPAMTQSSPTAVTQPPPITVTAPAPTVVIAPAETPAWVWALIAIGSVLTITLITLVIILISRTKRIV